MIALNMSLYIVIPGCLIVTEIAAEPHAFMYSFNVDPEVTFRRGLIRTVSARILDTLVS